ncbi:AAA family ATPase [Bacteroidota bacterium]
MIRIAVTGPESTGKSTLAKKLAEHYNTVWVPEYAREYIERLDHPYTYDEVEQIAITQIHNERAALKFANKVLFSDTELLVIKIWMEHKFNRIPDWLEKKIMERKYDFYLLCNIDIPWESDPQREHPELRKYFFGLYKSELISRGFNFEIISGNAKNRLQSAVALINNIKNS